MDLWSTFSFTLWNKITFFQRDHLSGTYVPTEEDAKTLIREASKEVTSWVCGLSSWWRGRRDCPLRAWASWIMMSHIQAWVRQSRARHIYHVVQIRHVDRALFCNWGNAVLIVVYYAYKIIWEECLCMDPPSTQPCHSVTLTYNEIEQQLSLGICIILSFRTV